MTVLPTGTSDTCPPFEPDAVFEALARVAASSLDTPAASIFIEHCARNARIHAGHGFHPHSQMPGRRICRDAMDLRRLVTGEAAPGDPPEFSFCAAAPIMDRGGEVLGSVCFRDSKPIEISGARLSTLHAVTQSIVASVEALREMSVSTRTARVDRQLRLSRALLAVTDIEAAAPDFSIAMPAALDALGTHLGWPAACAWAVDARGYLTHPMFAFASPALSGAAAEMLRTAERPPQILDLLATAGAKKLSRCGSGVAAVPLLGQTSPVVLELWMSPEDRGDEAWPEMLDSFAQQYTIIAARAETTARLRASEAECRDLFDHSLDCICVHDTEGRLIRVNRSMAQILGYDDPSELIGRSIRSLLVPAVAKGFDRYLDTLIAEGIAEGSMLVRTRTGERRVFHYRNTMRLDGGYSVVLSIARDITDTIAARRRVRRAERKQTRGLLQMTREARENEDRAHRERLSEIAHEWTTIFDAMPLPMLVVDENLAIDRINRAAAALLGDAPSATMTLRDCVDREPWATVAEICRGNLDLSREVTSSATDHVWDVAVSGHEVQEQGRRQSIVVIRDVTVSHDLQRSVRQSEAMSELGTLVLAVAHEMRNPLAGIAASLDALEACHDVGPPPVKFITRLRHELSRLNSVTVDLLEYGRARPLLLRELSIEDLIAAGVSACQVLAESRGVEVQIVPFRSTVPTIADRDRILQVLQNAFENAIQHSPRGGRVRICAREESRATGIWTTVTVEDQGPGFELGSLHRVFEPFFTRRPGGTGLGLALVRRFVREHGGTATARNSPNGGAVIEIALRNAKR